MINGFKKSDFTKEQFEIIRDGLEAGVDIYKYANPEYSEDKMLEILEKLQQKRVDEELTTGDLNGYMSSDFSEPCRIKLIDAFAEGLDVKAIANPEFNEKQLEILIEGLRKGLDVTVYANPEYDWVWMGRIYAAMLNPNIEDITPLLNHDLSYSRVYQIYEALNMGVYIEELSNLNYSHCSVTDYLRVAGRLTNKSYKCLKRVALKSLYFV